MGLIFDICEAFENQYCELTDTQASDQGTLGCGCVCVAHDGGGGHFGLGGLCLGQ